jgi:hypothetical protein
MDSTAREAAALDAEADETFDMANLSEARTGVPGVIWISTQVGRHGPRVKYFQRAGRDQPSFSMSIDDAPRVLASDLPERVVTRMAPEVAEWVRLNRAALLAFWADGDTWLKEQVDAHIDSLKPLP